VTETCWAKHSQNCSSGVSILQLFHFQTMNI